MGERILIVDDEPAVRKMLESPVDSPDHGQDPDSDSVR